MIIDPDDADWVSPSAMNSRSLCGLTGYGPATAGSLADQLCELLRSKHEISRDVREALADAIERGRSGYRVRAVNEENGEDLPWLEIGGLGRSGEIAKFKFARRRWVDAAYEVEAERLTVDRRTKRTGTIVHEVGERYGLGPDGMKKKARPFFKALEAAFADLNHPLHAECEAQSGFRYGEDDYYWFFVSGYIEHKAIEAVDRGLKE
jgi:hypothetical protein